MAETKTAAQQERENEEKAKKAKEDKDNAVDDQSVPEDERNHSLGELEGRMHAAESHKRLANQVAKEDFQEQQRREQIAQGPELYEEAKAEYEEAHDDQAKLEEAMRGEDFVSDIDITKRRAPSSDKTRSDKASDK